MVIDEVAAGTVYTVPVPSTRTGEFLAYRVIPVGPGWDDGPPRAPLLIGFTDELPPLLVTDDEPGTPVDEPGTVK